MSKIRAILDQMVKDDPELTYALVLLREDKGEIVSNICCLKHLSDVVLEIDASTDREIIVEH